MIANLALLVVPVLAAGLYRLEIVKLWVSPGSLALLMAANLGLLLYRCLAAIDAYRGVGRSRVKPRPWLVRSGLLVTAVMLATPHVAFGYLTVTQYSLLSTVFASGDRPVALEPAGGDSDGALAASEVEAGEPPGQSPVSGGTTTTTVLSTTTTKGVSPLWDGRDRLNILLLGADAGEGRRGLRTDTTILASIDPETGDAAMFSIPRDLSGAPLPTEMGIWGCDCFPDLITHLYDAGVKNPEAFPGPQEPPINGIKAAVGEILGLDVHYYAMVTLEGFVDIVDSLGGVTIDVPRTIRDETYPHENGTTVSVEIPEGTWHLNGHEALAYARIRRYSDDFSRMHRQRCVLEAIAEQTTPAEILLRFGSVAEALKRSLKTDIPQELLPDFVDLIPKVSTDRISTLRITRDVYKTGSGPGRTYYDTDRIRRDAQALLAAPETAMADLGLEDLDDTCGVSE